jgi:hypothetical protein
MAVIRIAVTLKTVKLQLVSHLVAVRMSQHKKTICLKQMFDLVSKEKKSYALVIMMTH